MNRTLRTFLVLAHAVTACAFLVAAPAHAEVAREGEWPADEKPVTLDLDRTPRSDALRKLADAAGWSVVAQGTGSDPVDVHVKDQPPEAVLEVLLSDGDFVAMRRGKLVSIVPAKDAAAAAAQVPVAAVASAPADAPGSRIRVKDTAEDGRGEDRKVTGGNLRIESGEVVHDVSVVGGELDVLGTVTGDVRVMGGKVRVHDGARVVGDVKVVGGELHVDDGASIDGDVGVVGGTLERGERSKIGGRLEIGSDEEGKKPGLLRRVGDAMTRSALLFVFGAVLLALAGRRMETLQGEVAARPMRSFAMGIVGFFGSVIVLAALAITIVGIPIAAVAAILGVIALYAGICAVLTVAGRAVLRHKTESPYAHLAMGCAMFLVLGNLPAIGDLLTMVVAVIGIGALVATRLAGLWPSKRNGGSSPGDHPYRAAA
jgi:hypothetical protein